MIELAIRRLRADAIIPERAYSGDAGLDLAACERVELRPGERAIVGTGLAVAIPEGYAGFVQPRSGLAARHGITIVNTPGLVDSGYRGELRVILLNTDTAETFVVERGMRIAQLVIVPLPEFELLEVDALPESERGVRGDHQCRRQADLRPGQSPRGAQLPVPTLWPHVLHVATTD